MAEVHRLGRALTRALVRVLQFRGLTLDNKAMVSAFPTIDMRHLGVQDYDEKRLDKFLAEYPPYLRKLLEAQNTAGPLFWLHQSIKQQARARRWQLTCRALTCARRKQTRLAMQLQP